MDYEKLYKEALERARVFYETKSPDCLILESIFPEFAESKDERIRKELLEYLDERIVVEKLTDTKIKKEWITWLEKQSETKQVTDFSDLKTWKLIVDAVLTKEHGIGQYLDSGITETYAKELLERFGNIKQMYVLEKQDEEKVYSVWVGGSEINDYYLTEKEAKKLAREYKENGYDDVIIEKQGKQKPFDYENANIPQKDFAPKAEPKFKVGDWIYHEISRNTIHINKIENGLYVSDEGATISFGRQNDWRLWTIEDAKDGDVLVFDGIIMIFKSIKTTSSANTYILYYNRILFDDWCDFGHNAHPATKEQRDFLFQKMHEVGYEWYAKTKQLIKIQS